MRSNFTCAQRSLLIEARTNYFKRALLALFAGCLSIVSLQSFGQTFPPPSNCVSKDLILVSATLPFAKCETCTPGSTITKPLTLGINNKTGSTRTSFAFWATLNIYNSDGSLASTSSISGCFNTIVANTINYYLYGNLTYKCGQSLALTNIEEAWTDASPKSVCATITGNNTSTINPKCGTVPMLNVVAGDDANYSVTNGTCTSTGSIKVFPFGGGGAPYTVSISTVNTTTVAQTVNNLKAGDSAVFNNLAAGTYTFWISDVNNCTPVVETRAVTATGSVPPPTSGGDQTQCQTGATSPTLTATATTVAGGTITWYNQASGGSVVTPSINTPGSTTFYAQASNGSCTSSSRTPVTLTITAAPAAPVSGGDQTACQTSTGPTLTAQATGSNVTWYSSSSGGSTVIPTLTGVGNATYYAQATANGCNSLTRTPVSLAVTAAPAAPTSGGDITQCALNPIQTLTATASGGTISWFDASNNAVANPTLNHVGTVTYYAQNTVGGCSSLTNTPVTLTINATPDAPSATPTQPTCVTGGSITITAVSGETFSFDNGPFSSTLTYGSLAASSSHSIVAENTTTTCTSSATTITLQGTPSAPAAPSICVTQPSLCGPTTGSVTIQSPTGSDYQYSIDNGNTWQTGTTFANLAPGSVTGIEVKQNSTGCMSTPISCDASNCSPVVVSMAQAPVISNNGTSVKAYPNPFNDQVKFVVTNPVGGRGSLEVWNMVGQKIATVYQGYIAPGSSTYNFRLSAPKSDALIYRLVLDGKPFTGKLLHIPGSN